MEFTVTETMNGEGEGGRPSFTFPPNSFLLFLRACAFIQCLTETDVILEKLTEAHYRNVNPFFLGQSHLRPIYYFAFSNDSHFSLWNNCTH